MSYRYRSSSFRPSRPKQKKNIKSIVGTGLIVAVLVVVFFYAVLWFRDPERRKPQEPTDSIADVLTATPESALLARAGLDLESEDARLYLIENGERIGIAERDEKKGRYVLDVQAALPPIDRETHFYEVWLLRQVPYGFFSAGEMVTNDLGVFVREWDGHRDQFYADYTNVIITLEAYDGNPDPGRHIAKGVFGNDD